MTNNQVLSRADGMACWLTVNASSMRDPIFPKERWMASEELPHASVHTNTQSQSHTK